MSELWVVVVRSGDRCMELEALHGPFESEATARTWSRGWLMASRGRAVQCFPMRVASTMWLDVKGES